MVLDHLFFSILKEMIGMISDILSFTLKVSSQDEALAFYTEKLGFEKRADLPMGPGTRWVTVAPPNAKVELVLQPTDWFEGEEREQHLARIGQSPTIVLRVDDCRQTCAELAERGVEVSDPPTETGYGVQAIIKDLHGNTLVLLERPN
jgi:predicted enzyme related to lactoylglutathione lyase